MAESKTPSRGRDRIVTGGGGQLPVPGSPGSAAVRPVGAGRFNGQLTVAEADGCRRYDRGRGAERTGPGSPPGGIAGVLARDRAVRSTEHPGTAPTTLRRTVRAQGRVHHRPDAAAGTPAARLPWTPIIRTTAARRAPRGRMWRHEIHCGRPSIWSCSAGDDLGTARGTGSGTPRVRAVRTEAARARARCSPWSCDAGWAAGRGHIGDFRLRLGAGRLFVRDRRHRGGWTASMTVDDAFGAADRANLTATTIPYGCRRPLRHRDGPAAARLRTWAGSRQAVGAGNGRRRRDSGRRRRRRGRGVFGRGRRARSAGRGRTPGTSRRPGRAAGSTSTKPLRNSAPLVRRDLVHRAQRPVPARPRSAPRLRRRGRQEGPRKSSGPGGADGGRQRATPRRRGRACLADPLPPGARRLHHVLVRRQHVRSARPGVDRLAARRRGRAGNAAGRRRGSVACPSSRSGRRPPSARTCRRHAGGSATPAAARLRRRRTVAALDRVRPGRGRPDQPLRHLPAGPGRRRAVWVGSPLRVHRRCEDPMFTVSNAVAYDGLMVYGTASRPFPDGERNGLLPSRWLNTDDPTRPADAPWGERDRRAFAFSSISWTGTASASSASASSPRSGLSSPSARRSAAAVRAGPRTTWRNAAPPSTGRRARKPTWSTSCSAEGVPEPGSGRQTHRICSTSPRPRQAPPLRRRGRSRVGPSPISTSLPPNWRSSTTFVTGRPGLRTANDRRRRPAGARQAEPVVGSSGTVSSWVE
ncbi:hypothetical protein SBADM41S_03124 [Streptomyces badius]